MRWRVFLSFCWYDLWVGAYWDGARHMLYVCPFPMFVLCFYRKEKTCEREK